MAQTKIQALQGLVGAGFSIPKGSTREVDSALAKQWEAAGLCKIIDKPKRTRSSKKDK